MTTVENVLKIHHLKCSQKLIVHSRCCVLCDCVRSGVTSQTAMKHLTIGNRYTISCLTRDYRRGNMTRDSPFDLTRISWCILYLLGFTIIYSHRIPCWYFTFWDVYWLWCVPPPNFTCTSKTYSNVDFYLFNDSPHVSGLFVVNSVSISVVCG